MYAPGRFTFNVNVQSIFDLYIDTADKVKEDYTVLNAAQPTVSVHVIKA